MRWPLLLILIVPLLFAITSEGGSYVVPRFWISPSGGFNGTLQTTSIYSAGYGSNGYFSALGPLYIDYPQVVSLDPVSSTVVNGEINLSCNVSDGEWLKNITFYSNYSGTYQMINWTSAYGHFDSAVYNITPTGDFVWSCEVCDVFGYCTHSSNQTIYYNVSIPNVTLVSPGNNSLLVPGTYNFSCNASDPNGISMINITIWKSGSLYYSNYTSFPGTSNESTNFSVLLTTGSYEWNCSATDSVGYVGYSNDTYVLTVFTANAPFIIDAYAEPHLITNGSAVGLFINATNANSLYANITHPNGYVQTVPLTNETIILFTNTSLIGRYNVTFFAENTATGDIANMTDFFISVPPINFSVYIVDHTGSGTSGCLRMFFYDRYYIDMCNSSGRFNVTIPEWVYNTSILSHSNSTMLNLSNLNVSVDTHNLVGMDIVSNYNSILYGYNSSISSPSGYIVQCSLDSLLTPITTYGCGSFDFSSMACSSQSAESGTFVGNYVLFTRSALGEFGYNVEHYVEPEPTKEKRMDLVISSTGCVEDSVSFEVRDRKSGDIVRAFVSITGPENYFKSIRNGKFTLKLPYVGKYKVDASASDYRSESDSFTLKSCYECSVDDDCADNEYCEGNRCVAVECECGHISNHKCHKYDCCDDDDCVVGYCYEHRCIECQSNDECAADEYCSDSNTCERLSCGCGYPEDHVCVAYECCEDSDCPESHICQDHTCEYVSVELDAPGEVVEGDEVIATVKVDGKPVIGRTVSINGINYVTNDLGQVKIKAKGSDLLITYNDIVKASKIVKVRKLMNLTIHTVEFFKGIPVEIDVTDSRGVPVISNLTIHVPGGDDVRFREVSSVEFIPPVRGHYYVDAESGNYVSASAGFYVDSCELFGFDFGRWHIMVDLCWYMWLVIFGMILLFAVVLMYLHKPKRKLFEEDEKPPLKGVLDEL